MAALILENNKDHLMSVKTEESEALVTREEFDSPKKPSDNINLGFNERKFVILSAVARFGEISAPRLARELNDPELTKQRIAELLLYYFQGKRRYEYDKDGKRKVRWFKLEYLKRRPIRMKDRATNRPMSGRPIYLYSLTGKGQRWLDRVTPLVQKGLAPRLDKGYATGSQLEKPETNLQNDSE